MKLTDVTPNLIVAEIARSMAFYQEVLGFAVVTTVPDASPFVFAWMQRDGVNVFLNSIQGMAGDLAGLAARPIGGTATMFFAVERDAVAGGIDEFFAQVSGRAEIVMPLKDQFYGMREFGVEDPDGYIILFAQRIG
ncbi:MAG: VOC family protein [Vicinamibacterales bacterium]